MYPCVALNPPLVDAAENGELTSGKLCNIVLEAREEMPVNVMGHLDRAMPQKSP